MADQKFFADLPDPPYPANTKIGSFAPQVRWEKIHLSVTWRLCPENMQNNLLRIWLESWNEVPAGSWENNDAMIAAVAKIPYEDFIRHRDILMRGWKIHSDGRLYHSFISEMVETMLVGRTGGAGRQKRHRQKMKEHRDRLILENSSRVTNPDIESLRVTCPQNIAIQDSNAPINNKQETRNKKQEKTPQEEKERKNTYVDLETEKPQNQIAAVERDAPDLCVSDSDSQTKTPERAVFEYWRDKMGHPKAKLASKRRRCINARLKEGYTVADICRAIDGCKASDWHQGKNDRKTVFDDIELICRDATKMDAFIAKADDASREQAKMGDFLSGTYKSALYPDPTDNAIEGEFHAI